jgi:hypothetical protein
METDRKLDTRMFRVFVGSNLGLKNVVERFDNDLTRNSMLDKKKTANLLIDYHDVIHRLVRLKFIEYWKSQVQAFSGVETGLRFQRRNLSCIEVFAIMKAKSPAIF